MRLALALFLPLAAALGAGVPRITYTKDFPRSTPAFTLITLDRDGKAQYREARDDDNPIAFQLAPEEAEEIFRLAAKVGYFRQPLEAKAKVANTGIKTFRYEDGEEKGETSFNYSTIPEAIALWDWFERITESERLYIALERAAKFDKLGVNQALLWLEVSRDRKRVVAAGQFLPLLDRIAKNESYIHMARERAASLADGFRKTAPPEAQP
jgi:hypothetical protein